MTTEEPFGRKPKLSKEGTFWWEMKNDHGGRGDWKGLEATKDPLEKVYHS